MPEILFCIQQLLTHPNHRGLYDAEEYRESVRLQAEKYNHGSDFLEKAMVGLQSKIDPEYKMPLQPWENVRWENLEEIRWKGIRSFQSRNTSFLRHRISSQDEVAESESSNNLSSASDDGENNDENINHNNEVVDSPSSRLVLVPIANTNSSELSSTRQMMSTAFFCDEDGNVCECSCCKQVSRQFLDKTEKMRYFFGEGS